MALGHRRRIFRSGLPALSLRSLAISVVALAAVGGGAWLFSLPWHLAGSAASSPAPDAEKLNATPAQVAVLDGATLRLQDRTVRLLGVQPPTRGTTCRANDGTGFDCGAAATNALAAMVQEVPVACLVRGHDEMGRPFAVCEASGTELNRAVIAAGWARADHHQPTLVNAEDAARAGRRGLWAGGADASW